MEWEVSLEPSLSDHRHILFTLRGSVLAPMMRNPRGPNWGSFQDDLREGLERRPEMEMKDEASLRLAVRWIQQALLSAYENNCPLRPIRKGKRSLRWTPLLASHRREVRRLFNRCQAKNDPYSWELYREAQQRYRGEVRKASKEIWRTFCGSINNLPRAARLQRALSGDPKVRLGSLWLLLESIRNPKGKPWTSCSLHTSQTPTVGVVKLCLLLPAAPNVWIGRWPRRL
jgi:hypothetical protein